MPGEMPQHVVIRFWFCPINFRTKGEVPSTVGDHMSQRNQEEFTHHLRFFFTMSLDLPAENQETHQGALAKKTRWQELLLILGQTKPIDRQRILLLKHGCFKSK